MSFVTELCANAIAIPLKKIVRRKIHTDVKIASFLNVLPDEYRNSVHRSQIFRYRNVDPEEYFGSELSTIVSKEIDFIRQLGNFPKVKNTAKAILKLFVFFRMTISKVKGFHKNLRKQKDFFVELSQRFRNEIPVNRFSKFIGIDESTFHNWIREVRVHCSDSLVNKCRRIHPNQLLSSETNKMKKLLTNPQFQYWPLISIYYHAMRNNLCSMALSTWYKYVPLLGIKRLKPRSVKSYGVSVKANAPNQYWHADVTKFRSVDGVWKLYLYSNR